jgi:phosphatidylserine/phosphatidylglycerophosphate/cardiolipin synthase-like enzyme
VPVPDLSESGTGTGKGTEGLAFSAAIAILPSPFHHPGGRAMSMTQLLLATGFTGGMALVFVLRWLHNWLSTPASVAVHFSPDGGCTNAVVNELLHAKHEILVQAYSFSSKPIAEALIAAKKKGVRVEILMDHSNEQEQYSDLHWFIEAGLNPLIDAKHAIAHNKVMIVDKRTLLTGSFNFTNQAESHNAENLLVLKGHPELVAAYRATFEAHKAHSQAPQPKVQAAKDHHRAAA